MCQLKPFPLSDFRPGSAKKYRQILENNPCAACLSSLCCHFRCAQPSDPLVLDRNSSSRRFYAVRNYRIGTGLPQRSVQAVHHHSLSSKAPQPSACFRIWYGVCLARCAPFARPPARELSIKLCVQPANLELAPPVCNHCKAFADQSATVLQ